MKESDWKIFKEIKEKAIDQFCEIALNEFRQFMDDEEEHIQNRYLLNFKLVQSRNQQMSLLFDGQSRSKATVQLIAIRGEGLADEELVEKLSDEFREKTDPSKHGW